MHSSRNSAAAWASKRYRTMRVCLGLGELTGYDLPEEQPGALPSEPPKYGGVARMSSFGQGIQITPFQLASLVSTLANGGTIYYLQYPRSPEAIQNFEPRVKRKLDIEALLPDIRDGMLAAVLYGTARRSYEGEGEQPLGKTGTCSDSESRVGWFVSYADQQHPEDRIGGSDARTKRQCEGRHGRRNRRTHLQALGRRELFRQEDFVLRAREFCGDIGRDSRDARRKLAALIVTPVLLFLSRFIILSLVACVSFVPVPKIRPRAAFSCSAALQACGRLARWRC